MKIPAAVSAAVGISTRALLVLLSAAATFASDDAVARGELLYRIHCASCHGPQGLGDGPVAGDLRGRPSDLTRLRDDEGEFPAERARRSIDGRETMGTHGSREMPIWGITFQQLDRTDDQEAEVAGRIDDLVTYLHSIQRGEED